MAQILRPPGFISSWTRPGESLRRSRKMLNFFKNLFGSGETENHSNGNGYATTAAPPPPPVQVQARTAAPVRQPAVQRPAPVAQHAPARPVSSAQGVQLPLYTIIAVLPLELKTRIRETLVADIFVTLPLDRVLTQLGSGAVKITFGELRALVPSVFTAQSNFDQTEIMLPLNEILPQISPEMIARRHSQRQVQIPEDVHGPFGNGLSGVTLADPRTAAPIKGSAPAPAAPQAPAPAPAPAPIFVRETKLTPPPAAAMRPTSPVRPAAPIPFAPPTPAAASGARSHEPGVGDSISQFNYLHAHAASADGSAACLSSSQAGIASGSQRGRYAFTFNRAAYAGRTWQRPSRSSDPGPGPNAADGGTYSDRASGAGGARCSRSFPEHSAGDFVRNLARGSANGNRTIEFVGSANGVADANDRTRLEAG